VRSVHILRSSWVFTVSFFLHNFRVECGKQQAIDSRSTCRNVRATLLFIRRFAVLVEDFEIPMKRSAVNLFYTLILNEVDRYCQKNSHQDCLYLMSRNDFAVGTVYCFLQQNKSFSFDPQHTLKPIIGVQNWFKRYAQLNILIILHMLLRLLKRNTKFQLNRSLVI